MKISILSLAFLFIGCFYYQAPTFKYTVFKEDRTISKINPFSQTEIGWSKCSEANEPSTCATTLNIEENNKSIPVGRVTIEFAWINDTAINQCLVGNFDKELFYWDNISVRFYIDPKTEGNYFFDSRDVYLIKNNKRINLQEIDYKTKGAIKGGVVNLNTRYNDLVYYKMPLFCKDLEGAEFLMDGFYRNGKELPPLRFKMNYKDKIKEKFNIN